jgi:hypothetical protein
MAEWPYVVKIQMVTVWPNQNFFILIHPAKLEGVFVLQQFEQKKNSKESIEMLEFFLSAGIREDE